MGEVQIESEGLPFVLLLPEVQFGLPRGGIEMFKSLQSPVSNCKKKKRRKKKRHGRRKRER